uniref:Uncharacterized protein n=1 Tax=Arundo donax TaxID=35708 RepID=A0A0A9GKE9_ARUDO
MLRHGRHHPLDPRPPDRREDRVQHRAQELLVLFLDHVLPEAADVDGFEGLLRPRFHRYLAICGVGAFSFALFSFAVLIMSIKVSSSNSMSLEMRSRATPSKISSVFSSPPPTAASQQQSRT